MAAYTNDSDYNNGLGVSSLYFIDDTSRYLTTDGIETITNKTIDFSLNTILNAGSNGEGFSNLGYAIAPATHASNLIPQWGASNSKTLIAGLVAPTGTLIGTTDIQTLTNKTIDYNLNTINNIPQFDSSTINTGISNINIRTSNLETLTANHTTQISNNILNITSLSNALSNDISNLSSLSTTIANHTTNITSLSNALALDISNLSSLSLTVSTHTTQISNNTSNITTNSNNISNRVIAPSSNTAGYLAQWGASNSKTLIDGINLATLATLSGIETLTNKTLTSTSNNIIAKGLHSTTTIVDVSSSSPPTAGQVLTATSSNSAQWTTPSSGGGSGGGYSVASITNFNLSMNGASSTSSNVTLSHSLGVVPKKITLFGTFSGTYYASSTNFTYYSGSANSIFLNYATTVCNNVISYGLYLNSQAGSIFSAVYNSTDVIFQTPPCIGIISSITSTNFTMNFAIPYSGSSCTCSGTLNFLFEA